MPNHVTNRLKVLGPKKKVIEAMTSIKGVDEETKKTASIDFNKIIEKPKSLDIQSGSSGWTAAFLLFGITERLGSQSHALEAARFASWSKEQQEEAIKLAFAYKENKETHGHTTWYEWCCDKWGTKWNAYDTPDARDTFDTVHFSTAWSCPHPVIEALSRKFPTLTFEIEWADEDTGNNAGWFRYKNGNAIVNAEFTNGSIAAFEMAFKLKPRLEEDYELIDGKYQYKDEE